MLKESFHNAIEVIKRIIDLFSSLNQLIKLCIGLVDDSSLTVLLVVPISHGARVEGLSIFALLFGGIDALLDRIGNLLPRRRIREQIADFVPRDTLAQIHKAHRFLSIFACFITLFEDEALAGEGVQVLIVVALLNFARGCPIFRPINSLSVGS